MSLDISPLKHCRPLTGRGVEAFCGCCCVYCAVTDAQETEEWLPGDEGSELLLSGHVWGLDSGFTLLPRANQPPGALVCG